MRCTQMFSVVSTASAITAALIAVGGVSPTGELIQPSLNQMTCFTIGASVECVDAGFIMPPMIVAGPESEGTDETLVIEDNGGYHEVRG